MPFIVIKILFLFLRTRVKSSSCERRRVGRVENPRSKGTGAYENVGNTVKIDRKTNK